jgi:hypothetical protein
MAIIWFFGVGGESRDFFIHMFVFISEKGSRSEIAERTVEAY